MGERSYSISELAREFGITTRTIRFYEEKGYIHPRREGRQRRYTPADRVRIKLILRGKRIGLSLAESVEIIDEMMIMRCSSDTSCGSRQRALSRPSLSLIR